MKFSAHIEEWPLIQTFRISGAEWSLARSLVVQISDGNAIGRGEAQGVYYLDETAESMFEQVQEIAGELRNGLTRDVLQELLPAGGARNALDCALWDLECKRLAKSIWQLTGIEPGPVTTAFTIGLEANPSDMAAKAAAAADSPLLKIKLDSHLPFEKLSAIRAARPDARLVVDVNEGWDFDLLREMIRKSEDLNLSMIEQPLKRGADRQLQGFSSPIPLAADESCLHRGELASTVGRYDMINIKLDKTGGLTEALALARSARKQGLKLMVGNMTGTSLAMAPSFVLAQLCDFADIDGPLLLRNDHPNGLQYHGGVVNELDRSLWG